MNHDGVMLAAGESRRFGDGKAGSKLLSSVGDQTLIEISLNALLGAPLKTLYLVTGKYHQDIVAHLHKRGWTTRFQEQGTSFYIRYFSDWAKGMGASLAYGVAQTKNAQVKNTQVKNAQAKKESPVMIALADQPLLTALDYQNLFDSSSRFPERIVVSRFDRNFGVPCIFPSHYKAMLLDLNTDRGAKDIIKKHFHACEFVDSPHAACDIDTPEDLAHFLNQNSKFKIQNSN